MGGEATLHLMPVILVVPDLFAARADWQHAADGFDLAQGLRELDVALVQGDFGPAPLHHLFSAR